MRAPAELEERVARWERIVALANLDDVALEALRLAVGRERARRGWEPFPAHGELGADQEGGK